MEGHKFVPVKTLNWLFFDLDSYFASVEQQDRPHLRSRPVAVIPNDTDSTCAIAASYEAKAYGIKTGTKIYDAKKLCPDLVCVLARHDVYVDYHHLIMDELEKHIHVSNVCSIDEAACRLMDNESTPALVNALAKKIKHAIRENIGSAITCSIGAAPNRFLAKIASDMNKPDGFVILEPGRYKEQLFTLRLKDLTGISTNMERRLNHAGIFTIEQLWNTSPKHARKIWNSVEGERFWYRLRGYDIPDQATTKRMVGHSRVLDPQHRNFPNARLIVMQLLSKAIARLRRYKLYARKLSLQIRTTDRRRWSNERVFSPTQDNFIMGQYMQGMWRDMLYDLKACRPIKVSITLYDLYESQEITLDLFETEAANRHNKPLCAAVESLNTRFGTGSVNIGMPLKAAAGHVGTKIAFTRIPEKEEF